MQFYYFYYSHSLIYLIFCVSDMIAYIIYVLIVISGSVGYDDTVIIFSKPEIFFNIIKEDYRLDNLTIIKFAYVIRLIKKRIKFYFILKIILVKKYIYCNF